MAERHGTEDEVGGSPLNRRSYMQLVGATGAVLSTGSVLSGTVAADAVDLGDEGLQDGDKIDGYLDDYFESGTEVHIPPGTYEWGGDGLDGSYSNAALIGDGEPGDVVLDAGDDSSRYNTIKGTGGEVLLENLTLAGSNSGASDKLRADARDSDCTVTLRYVWKPDGTEKDGMGFFVGPEHAGEVRFEHCWAEGFGDNGLYADAPGKSSGEGGRVVVEGGLYRNNNIANVRLGAPNSVARGVTMVQDETFDKRSSVNQRNLRVRQPGDDIVVEDCDIYHALGSYRPVSFSSQIDSGSGVIRDTRIYTESSSGAIRSHEGDWTAENLHLSGDGDESIGISTDGVCTGSDCEEAASRPLPPLPNSRDGEVSTDEEEEESEENPHVVAFVTSDDAGRSNYKFTAEELVEPVEKSTYESPSGNVVRAASNFKIEDGDAYRVEGHTANGYGDAYEVHGAVTDVSLDNPDGMAIQLDGETVSEEELLSATNDEVNEESEDNEGDEGDEADEGAEDELSNTIVIDGTGGDDVGKYTFSVSGDVAEHEELTTTETGCATGSSIPSNISDDRVIGVVGDARDAYRYSGTVTSVQVRGDATVSLDRE